MIEFDRSEALAILRGVLQSTLALLAAASFGGWVVTLVFLTRSTGSDGDLRLAFVVVTVLYALLALAVGNAMGRRQGTRGITIAALSALLAWGILELNFALWQIGSDQMRVPFIVGVATAAVGAAIGVSRAADREALRVQLQEELRELAEDEQSGLRTASLAAGKSDAAVPEPEADDRTEE